MDDIQDVRNLRQWSILPKGLVHYDVAIATSQIWSQFRTNAQVNTPTKVHPSDPGLTINDTTNVRGRKNLKFDDPPKAFSQIHTNAYNEDWTLSHTMLLLGNNRATN